MQFFDALFKKIQEYKHLFSSEEYAKRFKREREKNNYRQSEIAECLHVTTQAVSLWEQGKNTPDISKLPEIANLFGVTVDWLLTGDEEEELPMLECPVSDRLYSENKMYTYVKSHAHAKKMYQTSKVLAYAKEQHEGQVRKGKDKVPYIYHPLQMVCHLLALGIDDDNLISAALLHDVCEDTDVNVQELPVNDVTKEVVKLLTKKCTQEPMNEKELEKYYEEISKNEIALMVKIVDRCSNVSGMVTAFSDEKLVKYINETERWFYPMIRKATTDFPWYYDQLFLVKYHISSVLAAIKGLLHKERADL